MSDDLTIITENFCPQCNAELRMKQTEYYQHGLLFVQRKAYCEVCGHEQGQPQNATNSSNNKS